MFWTSHSSRAVHCRAEGTRGAGMERGGSALWRGTSAAGPWRDLSILSHSSCSPLPGLPPPGQHFMQFIEVRGRPCPLQVQTPALGTPTEGAGPAGKVLSQAVLRRVLLCPLPPPHPLQINGEDQVSESRGQGRVAEGRTCL